MEYDRVLGDAFRLTIRYRFLWLFAFLGGASTGGSGGSPNFNFGSPGSAGSSDVPPELQDLARSVQNLPAFLMAHMAQILIMGGILALIGLVFLILSFIAKGALIGSVARLGLGEEVSLGSGWRIGQSFGWCYFRLFLVTLVLGLIVLLLIGAVVLVFILLIQGSGESLRTLAIIAAVLLGISAFFALVILAIGFSIVLEYADRAVVVENLGALASISRGYEVFRARLWPSALVWIISVAVAIAIGIALAVPALIIAIPLGGAVFGTYANSGFTAPTFVAGAIAALIWIVMIWGLGAIGGTYTSSYWTLSYLMLTDRYPPARPVAESAPLV